MAIPADPCSCGTFWPWTADLLVAENLRKCGSGIDEVANPRPLLPANVEENWCCCSVNVKCRLASRIPRVIRIVCDWGLSVVVVCVFGLCIWLFPSEIVVCSAPRRNRRGSKIRVATPEEWCQVWFVWNGEMLRIWMFHVVRRCVGSLFVCVRLCSFVCQIPLLWRRKISCSVWKSMRSEAVEFSEFADSN